MLGIKYTSDYLAVCAFLVWGPGSPEVTLSSVGCFARHDERERCKKLGEMCITLSTRQWQITHIRRQRSVEKVGPEVGMAG